MNNQDQVPTIAELWKELQMLNISIRSDEWTIVHPNHFCRPFVLQRIEDRKVMRQQLVERCESVKDGIGNWRSLYISPSGQICNTCQSSYDTAETAHEMSAAYEFLAWELEQREKESKDD